MNQEKLIIPKIIHFIWAGGNNLMPNESINIVIEWAAKHSTWEIYLWIDQKTCWSNLQNEYTKLFNNQRGNTIKVNIFEGDGLVACLPTEINIKLKDIRKEKMIDENSQYEIERMTPNFGASSDLLRCNILYGYGGAYFDTDIEPGEDSLDSIDMFPKQHTLYVEHNTQKRRVSSEKRNRFSINHIGNDSFICTKGNPLMQKIYQAASDNYCKNGKGLAYQIQRAHQNMRETTIRFTGPHLVRKVIENNLCFTSKYNILNIGLFRKKSYKAMKDNTIIMPMRDEAIELARPLASNTTHWLKPKTFANNEATVLAIIQDTIRFEAEKFGILRLDEHIRDLTNFYLQEAYFCEREKRQHETIMVDKAARTINDILVIKQVQDLRSINFIQVTGVYQTIDWDLVKQKNNIYKLRGDNLVDAVFGHLNEQFLSVLGAKAASIIPQLTKSLAEKAQCLIIQRYKKIKTLYQHSFADKETAINVLHDVIGHDKELYKKLLLSHNQLLRLELDNIEVLNNELEEAKNQSTSGHSWRWLYKSS